MKILLCGLLLAMHLVSFGQAAVALAKLKKAHSNYELAMKKAKEALAYIDACFNSNRNDLIIGYAKGGGLVASNAGAYARNAESLSNEVKQSEGACPKAKYRAEITEEYFSQAHRNFSDAYFALSKTYQTNDALTPQANMDDTNTNLQNALCFLHEGIFQLEWAGTELSETIELLKNDCR